MNALGTIHMKGTQMNRALSFASISLIVVLATPAKAETNWSVVDTILTRTGAVSGQVHRYGLPRSDLNVSLDGVALKPGFALGGWVAFEPMGDKAMMMGDLVLTESEVNPVMSALLDNGLEVTALHNHFFRDEPRMFYMHVHGHGKPAELARKVKPALDLIGKAPSHAPASAPPAAVASTIDTARIAQIVGAQGEQTGAVFKITIGRDDLKLTEMGAPINARMGLNTWAAFVGTNENAAIAGDVAMLAGEVTPVLKALRQNGLDVVAIHHHMTDTQPTIYFLHYWGTGPTDKLARGFKAALDQLGKAR